LPRELLESLRRKCYRQRTRRAILTGIRKHNIRITHKTTALKLATDDEGRDLGSRASKALLPKLIRIADQSADARLWHCPNSGW